MEGVSDIIFDKQASACLACGREIQCPGLIELLPSCGFALFYPNETKLTGMKRYSAVTQQPKNKTDEHTARRANDYENEGA